MQRVSLVPPSGVTLAGASPYAAVIEAVAGGPREAVGLGWIFQDVALGHSVVYFPGWDGEEM
jgi:hypothetical protein